MDRLNPSIFVVKLLEEAAPGTAGVFSDESWPRPIRIWPNPRGEAGHGGDGGRSLQWADSRCQYILLDDKPVRGRRDSLDDAAAVAAQASFCRVALSMAVK